MKEITIGRSDDNTLVLNGSKVSRHHCRCYEENGTYYIEDTNSTNGVFVNDKRISGVSKINSESKIGIGETTYDGADLIAKIKDNYKQEGENDAQEIYSSFANLRNRYSRNLEFINSIIKEYPLLFSQHFSTNDDKITFWVEKYNQQIDALIEVAELLSKSSQRDLLNIQCAIDKLSHLALKKEKDAKEILKLRQQLLLEEDVVTDELTTSVTNAFNVIEKQATLIFDDFRETALLDAPKWNQNNLHGELPLRYIQIGVQPIKLPFFTQQVILNKRILIPFLDVNHLTIHYTNNQESRAQSLVTSIIARTIAATHPGDYIVHMMDLYELSGTSNMLKLLNGEVYSIQSKFYDVSNTINSLDTYMEDVIHNELVGQFSNIRMFNSGKENKQPYHIVVLKNFPYGLSTAVSPSIVRLLNNGVKAGIHFVFMFNDDIVNSSEEYTKIIRLSNFEEERENVLNMTLNEQIQYDKFEDKCLQDIIRYVNEGFNAHEDEVLPLTDYLLNKEEWWQSRSDNRIDIPFGLNTIRQNQELHITQESGQNSAIIIGIPGSGKSVLLHSLILNASVKYSPKELQLYLLDFSGVEFNMYATHKLPQARVIAPEAERELGLSVLRELKVEGERRMALCRENDVKNIVELRQKRPDIVVPRMLAIIDEFQKIFEIDNDAISREANSIIHVIIQEFRKFGINIILATQKLPSSSIVPSDLIANRIVFKCSPQDVDRLIPRRSNDDNILHVGDCLYNSESGAEQATIRTHGYFVSLNEIDKILEEITEFAQKQGIENNDNLIVFRGNDQPDFIERKTLPEHDLQYENPEEIGVYLGQSIAISDVDVYASLQKENGNNILIVGGEHNIAERIAITSMASISTMHKDKSAQFVGFNFMRNADPLHDLPAQMFNTDVFNYNEVYKADDVTEVLCKIKEEIQQREKCEDESAFNIYLAFYAFQNAMIFSKEGGKFSASSPAGQALEYIIQHGPAMGVFVIIQVDRLEDISNRLSCSLTNFVHRVALQMTEEESTKLVGNLTASRLFVMSKPATKYRALYRENNKNITQKFIPYKL